MASTVNERIDVLNGRQFDRDLELSAARNSTEIIWALDTNVEPMSSHPRRLAYTLLRRGKTLTALLRLRSATHVLASADLAERAMAASANDRLLSPRRRPGVKCASWIAAEGSARDILIVVLTAEGAMARYFGRDCRSSSACFRSRSLDTIQSQTVSRVAAC